MTTETVLHGGPECHSTDVGLGRMTGTTRHGTGVLLVLRVREVQCRYLTGQEGGVKIIVALGAPCELAVVDDARCRHRRMIVAGPLSDEHAGNGHHSDRHQRQDSAQVSRTSHEALNHRQEG